MALIIRVHERLNEAFSPKTVKIGDQVWMAENLNVDDGKGGITYNEDNGEYYYTYDAAMRVAKSIPGWHLPTALDWNEAALACGGRGGSTYKQALNYTNVQELVTKLNIKEVISAQSPGIYLWTAGASPSRANYYYISPTGTYMDLEVGSRNFAMSTRLVKD